LHDGSAATLADVIEFYDRGGVSNPTLDSKIRPLHLTDAEQADLIAFLQALTGTMPSIDRPRLPD
jgi:cytochrome c peroxidase